MRETVKERLQSFGYELQEGDEITVAFAVDKVTNTIRNICNVLKVPDGLMCVAVDMAAGEFLKMKKTFSPIELSGLDLDAVVKQLSIGDTSVTFAVGDGTQTAEQRLDAFIDHLLNFRRGELTAYRQVRW